MDAVCEAEGVIGLLCDAAKEETDDDVRGLSLKLLYQVLSQRSGEALREAQASGKISKLADAPTEAAKTMSEFSRSIWETVKAEAEAIERKAGEAAGKGKGGGTS